MSTRRRPTFLALLVAPLVGVLVASRHVTLRRLRRRAAARSTRRNER